MNCTAAHYQEVIKLFWLQFWRPFWLSIFLIKSIESTSWPTCISLKEMAHSKWMVNRLFFINNVFHIHPFTFTSWWLPGNVLIRSSQSIQPFFLNFLSKAAPGTRRAIGSHQNSQWPGKRIDLRRQASLINIKWREYVNREQLRCFVVGNKGSTGEREGGEEGGKNPAADSEVTDIFMRKHLDWCFISDLNRWKTRSFCEGKQVLSIDQNF